VHNPECKDFPAICPSLLLVALTQSVLPIVTDALPQMLPFKGLMMRRVTDVTDFSNFHTFYTLQDCDIGQLPPFFLASVLSLS
jgi:hypothetical protein